MGVMSIILVASLPLVLGNQMFYYFPIIPSPYLDPVVEPLVYRMPGLLPSSMGNRWNTWLISLINIINIAL